MAWIALDWDLKPSPFGHIGNVPEVQAILKGHRREGTSYFDTLTCPLIGDFGLVTQKGVPSKKHPHGHAKIEDRFGESQPEMT